MGTKVFTLRVSNGKIINHCHIVWDEFTKDAVLIDPAWEVERFFDLISVERLRVRAVLLTHHHFDHTNLADVFSSALDIPIYMSFNEAKRYKFFATNLEYPSINEEMKLGALSVLTIDTPGHTAGSVCYLIADCLFTGDTLFNEGCGVCWGPGADPQEMFNSLQKLKMIIPPETRVYPGHKYISDLGKQFRELKISNIYLCIDHLDTFIKFRMRKNQNRLFEFI